nr:LPS assembly protein LptD [Phaeovibrio sulfidiphilus]
MPMVGALDPGMSGGYQAQTRGGRSASSGARGSSGGYGASAPALPMVGALDMGTSGGYQAPPRGGRPASSGSRGGSGGYGANAPALPMVGALDMGTSGGYQAPTRGGRPASSGSRGGSGGYGANAPALPMVGALDMGTSGGYQAPTRGGRPASTGARGGSGGYGASAPALPMVGALDMGTSGGYQAPTRGGRPASTGARGSSGGYGASAPALPMVGALDMGTSSSPATSFNTFGSPYPGSAAMASSGASSRSGRSARSFGAPSIVGIYGYGETGGLRLPAGLAPNPSSMGLDPHEEHEDRASDILAPGQVFISADEMVRDDDLDLVTARGNVLVVSGENALRADVVSFNRAQNRLSASGNVSLVKLDDPKGGASFAEYMELSDDLKDGFVRNVQVLTGEGGRMAGAYAEQDSGARRKELSRGVYTMCRPCSTLPESGPTRPPIWQIKAAKVIHDEEKKEIIFRDAWLELLGIPTLYVPFLTQPDPTVYRRSGIMAPSVGTGSRRGIELLLPYYAVMDDYGDAILVPRFGSRDHFSFDGTVARNFDDGELWLRTVFTPLDRNERFQGYYETKGAFNLNPVWSARFESGLTREAKYLRRMDINPVNDADFLVNRLAIEGYGNRSRASVEGFYFQTVTEEFHQKTLPAIPFYTDVLLRSDPLWSNGHVEASLNSMVLQRRTGTDSSRLIGRVAYELPFYDGLGGAYTLSAGLRGDIYHARDLVMRNGETFSGSRGRFVPQGSLVWRHPLVRASATSTHILEPKVGVFAALPSNNPKEIANEDSRYFALDMNNLFRPSRVPGYDRVEGGQWVSYALHYGYIGDSGPSFDLDVGQSYRFQKDRALFRPGSGQEKNLSNLLTRMRVYPADHVTLQYDAQLSQENLAPRRHDLKVYGDYGPISGDIGYVYAEDITAIDGHTHTSLEEVSGTLRFQLGENWSLRGGYIYNLDKKETVRTAFGLNYEDECLIVATKFSKDFTREYGIKGGTSLMMTVTLKTLGSYSFSPAPGLD